MVKLLRLVNETLKYYVCYDDKDNRYLVDKVGESHLYMINGDNLLLFDKFSIT